MAKKGTPAWNKNIPMTEEAKKHLSKINTGRPSSRKGCVCSEETKEKIRQARALQIMLPMSDARKKKVSETHKGKIVSEEQKEKIRQSRKKQVMLPCSPETKNKISIAHLGTHHTDAYKKAQHEAFITGKRFISHKAGRGKRSYYTSPLQGQVCFRSSYELAYAKYLDSISELWMYEMETFDLGDITYTPDFFLPRKEKFIEIKGYMNEKSQTKINQFKEQYPWNLEILGLKELKLLEINL